MRKRLSFQRNPWFDPSRIQGREYSFATGFYYFRARWYDPVTARWLSKDPIGITGGLNLYAFCGSNPINLVDPLGLSDEDRIMAITVSDDTLRGDYSAWMEASTKSRSRVHVVARARSTEDAISVLEAVASKHGPVTHWVLSGHTGGNIGIRFKSGMPLDLLLLNADQVGRIRRATSSDCQVLVTACFAGKDQRSLTRAATILDRRIHAKDGSVGPGLPTIPTEIGTRLLDSIANLVLPEEAEFTGDWRIGTPNTKR